MLEQCVEFIQNNAVLNERPDILLDHVRKLMLRSKHQPVQNDSLKPKPSYPHPHITPCKPWMLSRGPQRTVDIHLLSLLSTPFIYTTWTQIHPDRTAGARPTSWLVGSQPTTHGFTFVTHHVTVNWLRTLLRQESQGHGR